MNNTNKTISLLVMVFLFVQGNMFGSGMSAGQKLKQEAKKTRNVDITFNFENPNYFNYFLIEIAFFVEYYGFYTCGSVE